MLPERKSCGASPPCQECRKLSCNGWGWGLIFTGSLKFRIWRVDRANGEYNLFTFRIYDSHNDFVPADFDSIQIAQGKYSVAGQMLPEDLSVVKDDLNTGDTKLDRVFAKNMVLPTRAKMTVDVSRTITYGSDDEIRIIVVEGPSENHFKANKTVGLLKIQGKALKKDLLRGTEITSRLKSPSPVTCPLQPTSIPQAQ